MDRDLSLHDDLDLKGISSAQILDYQPLKDIKEVKSIPQKLAEVEPSMKQFREKLDALLSEKNIDIILGLKPAVDCLNAMLTWDFFDNALELRHLQMKMVKPIIDVHNRYLDHLEWSLSCLNKIMTSKGFQDYLKADGEKMRARHNDLLQIIVGLKGFLLQFDYLVMLPCNRDYLAKVTSLSRSIISLHDTLLEIINKNPVFASMHKTYFYFFNKQTQQIRSMDCFYSTLKPKLFPLKTTILDKWDEKNFENFYKLIEFLAFHQRMSYKINNNIEVRETIRSSASDLSLCPQSSYLQIVACGSRLKLEFVSLKTLYAEEILDDDKIIATIEKIASIAKEIPIKNTQPHHDDVFTKAFPIALYLEKYIEEIAYTLRLIFLYVQHYSQKLTNLTLQKTLGAHTDILLGVKISLLKYLMKQNFTLLERWPMKVLGQHEETGELWLDIFDSGKNETTHEGNYARDIGLQGNGGMEISDIMKDPRLLQKPAIESENYLREDKEEDSNGESDEENSSDDAKFKEAHERAMEARNTLHKTMLASKKPKPPQPSAADYPAKIVSTTVPKKHKKKKKGRKKTDNNLPTLSTPTTLTPTAVTAPSVSIEEDGYKLLIPNFGFAKQVMLKREEVEMTYVRQGKIVPRRLVTELEELRDLAKKEKEESVVLYLEDLISHCYFCAGMIKPGFPEQQMEAFDTSLGYYKNLTSYIKKVKKLPLLSDISDQFSKGISRNARTQLDKLKNIRKEYEAEREAEERNLTNLENVEEKVRENNMARELWQINCKLYLISEFNPKKCNKIKGPAVILTNKHEAFFIDKGVFVKSRSRIKHNNRSHRVKINRENIKLTDSKDPILYKPSQESIKIIRNATWKGLYVTSTYVGAKKNRPKGKMTLKAAKELARSKVVNKILAFNNVNNLILKHTTDLADMNLSDPVEKNIPLQEPVASQPCLDINASSISSAPFSPRLFSSSQVDSSKKDIRPRKPAGSFPLGLFIQPRDSKQPKEDTGSLQSLFTNYHAIEGRNPEGQNTIIFKDPKQKSKTPISLKEKEALRDALIHLFEDRALVDTTAAITRQKDLLVKNITYADLKKLIDSCGSKSSLRQPHVPSIVPRRAY